MPAPIVAYWEGLPTWITLGLAVLAALLVLGIAVYGWVWWPRRVVARLALDDPKARADVEDNFRKTVGQALGSVVVLLGGIAALLGAGMAYLQLSQQQRAAHDLLISNQVAKGFELLGNKDKDAVILRLGGIYALEGVMNNSDQYSRPVLEALTAFVREGTKLPTPPAPGSPTQGPPTDIQAALTVIGRRSAGEGAVNLTKANIAGATLDGATLAGADLIGADLTRANLSFANLAGADLNGANLVGADLSFATLAGANLTHADLTNADLNGANLNRAILADANLTHADLTKANLTGANLAGATLIGANLADANLTDAYLRGATLDGKQQLDVACGSDAKLPKGLTLKSCPPKSP
jgi:uncharacterized protein YjbI with pentapeptide repeats